MQASKDCVKNTLKKLEEKVAVPSVLECVRPLLASPHTPHVDKHHIAVGLAHLAPLATLHGIFCEWEGLDVLGRSALFPLEHAYQGGGSTDSRMQEHERERERERCRHRPQL